VNAYKLPKALHMASRGPSPIQWKIVFKSAAAAATVLARFGALRGFDRDTPHGMTAREFRDRAGVRDLSQPPSRYIEDRPLTPQPEPVKPTAAAPARQEPPRAPEPTAEAAAAPTPPQAPVQSLIQGAPASTPVQPGPQHGHFTQLLPLLQSVLQQFGSPLALQQPHGPAPYTYAAPQHHPQPIPYPAGPYLPPAPTYYAQQLQYPSLPPSFPSPQPPFYPYPYPRQF
jgi:hypothetical protein